MPRYLSAVRHGQFGDESETGRNHMRGQTRTACGENFALGRRVRFALVAEHNLSEHQRARDWALPRECSAHTHSLCALSAASTSSGWTFAPPTLMISAPPADEIEAIAAQIDDVAGINEAVLVSDCGRVGAEKAKGAAV